MLVHQRVDSLNLLYFPHKRRRWCVAQAIHWLGAFWALRLRQNGQHGALWHKWCTFVQPHESADANGIVHGIQRYLSRSWRCEALDERLTRQWSRGLLQGVWGLLPFDLDGRPHWWVDQWLESPAETVQSGHFHVFWGGCIIKFHCRRRAARPGDRLSFWNSFHFAKQPVVGLASAEEKGVFSLNLHHLGGVESPHDCSWTLVCPWGICPWILRQSKASDKPSFPYSFACLIDH